MSTHPLWGIWNLFHHIWVLHQLYKVDALTIHGVYKVIFLWRISIDFDPLPRFFPTPKIRKLSSHTFLYHTLISCMFLYSHMIIWILTPLNDWRVDFIFKFSLLFPTRGTKAWIKHIFSSFNMMCMEFVPLYKCVILII